MSNRTLLRSSLGLLLILAPLIGALAGSPDSSAFDRTLARLKAAPPDTGKLQLYRQLTDEAPPGYRLQPLLEEGRRLAVRLHRRDRALQIRSRMVKWAADQQDFVLATRHAQALLREARQAPVQPQFIALAYNGLGEVAGINAHFQEARHWFRLGLSQLADVPPSEKRLQMLATGYSNLSQGYIYEMDTYESACPDSLARAAHWAVRNIERLAREYRAAGNERQYLGYMGNAWDAYTLLADKKGQHDSARVYKERALAVFTRLQAWPLVALRRQQLAALEVEMGNLEKARTLARQALAEAEEMQQLNVQHDALQLLALTSEKLGKPAEALQYFKRQRAIQDSIFSADRRDELARLQVQFDTELKESQIGELRQKEKLRAAEAAQQQQRLWMLGLTLGLVIVGLSVTIVLILRLRRSRTQLAVMIQTKDRLYALVAHDLRGPVQSLDSVPGIIKMYLRRNDVEALNELPPLIADAVRQVNQLLDNLLHWAASQTGELSFHPERLPVQLLLDECVALWNNTATANQVQLVVPPAPTGITVRADPQMVRTVLRNLVGNALKFTSAGGTVTLAVEADAARTTLLVRDTGPGISAADAAALLRVDAAPDSRLRRSGARGEKGTGLGLRLCVLFMRRHGGSLVLDGQPGTGTTARATFPAN